MAKILVLIRHGKAQPRETWRGDDAARPLTPGGERSLAARMPATLSLLGKDADKAQVWASPSLRTVQTATIVSAILGARAPEERECLWAQDADAFLRELESCEAGAVIAVGHNPFVDDVTARLTGVRLPFFPGAAAALRVERGTASSSKPLARLLWYVEGPKAARWGTLATLEGVLVGACEAVDARLQAYFENPDDPETMHKLRVSIRTMRSLVAFVAPFQKSRQNASMQRGLRTVVRWTSRLRELDVLRDQANGLDAPSDDFVAACSGLRDAERDRVSAKLRGKKARRLLAGVRRAADCIEWKDSVAQEGLSRKALRARFSALVGELEEALATLDAHDAEATHDVRKEAKRVRYAAENFGALLDEDAVAVARRMVKTQDGLGAVCDARVNLEIIDDFPRKGLSSEALQALDALRERNQSFLDAFLGDADSSK